MCKKITYRVIQLLAFSPSAKLASEVADSLTEGLRAEELPVLNETVVHDDADDDHHGHHAPELQLLPSARRCITSTSVYFFILFYYFSVPRGLLP